MKIILLAFALLLSLPQPACAADPVEMFRRAGGLFEKKDFPGAVAKYRGIVEQGIENGAVYYNMGNAFFKNGKLGEAILAYERALKYLPRDGDIRANLEFARLLSVKKEDKQKRFNFSALFERFLKTFSVNEWTLSFETVYALLFFSAIIAVFAERERIKKTTVRVLVITLPVWFLTGSFMGIRIYWAAFRKEAVAIENNIKVHSGPAENYTLLLSVPEGTKMLIRQQREQWLQVTLPNGYSGWVNTRSVGII
jgi:tetratricopeptide (TPR) repeat protein